MASLSEQMQDKEKLAKELLKKMASSKSMNMLDHSLTKQEQMIDKLLDTRKTAAELIKELMTVEENVAQKLSDREEELKASLRKLQKIEESVLQAREKDAKLRTNTNKLREELEALKQEIRQQQQKIDEGANESMSARYLVQLYYKISQIDWDYKCEPTIIRGIHYGPDIAQPLNIDSSQHPSYFISDYLWSFVNTSW